MEVQSAGLNLLAIILFLSENSMFCRCIMSIFVFMMSVAAENKTASCVQRKIKWKI